MLQLSPFSPSSEFAQMIYAFFESEQKADRHFDRFL